MSMKKKLTVVVTAVTLVALIAIGATLAWFTDSKEVTNVVTMGNIKITLEEPIFSEENENNTITGVLPNQPIDKDPTITNVGNNDAYIRAKINYDGLSAEQAAQVEALLNIDEEAWVKGADGRMMAQAQTGTSKRWPADLVLIAMGFTGPEDTLLQAYGLTQDARGNVLADNFMTVRRGVFAAGDMHIGQSLVVRAIDEGQRAARACHAYLMAL